MRAATGEWLDGFHVVTGLRDDDGCLSCGEPCDRARCGSCRERQAESARSRRAARAATGRCRKCGGEPAAGGKWCERCRLLGRGYEAAFRRRACPRTPNARTGIVTEETAQ